MTTQQVAVRYSLGGFVFDATFSEAHKSSLKISDNPLETGNVVSDHAFLAPRTVTISAGVSDTPLHVAGDDVFAGPRRSARAYELLCALQAAAEPFDVQTGLKLYTNMAIEELSTEQDKETVGALVFEAQLREVNIVTTQSVRYPPRAAGATKRQAGAKTDNGEQQGAQATGGKKSLLKRLFG